MQKAYIILLFVLNCSLLKARTMDMPDNSNNRLLKGLIVYTGHDFSDTINNSHLASKKHDDPLHSFKNTERADNYITKGLFVKASISKPECYLGEPVIATYKLYSRLNSKSKITRQPRLEGFNVSDMIDMVSIAETTDTINDVSYKVHILRKSQLVPLQIGTLTLDPIELENRVWYTGNTNQANRQDKKLDELFDRLLKEETAPTSEHSITMQSKPVTVMIKALPEQGKPANFTGAVGQFIIKSNLVPGNLVMNEVSKLRVEITGNGYEQLIETPVIQWPSGIELINVLPIESRDNNETKAATKKVFEYAFIPKKAGNIIIPAVSFSFFNPNPAIYQSIQSQPVAIEIGRGNGITTHKQISPASRTINTIPTNRLNFNLEIILAVIFILGLIALLLGNSFLKARKLFMISRVSPVKNNSMPVIVDSDPLIEVKTLPEHSSQTDFYKALHTALWKLISEKLQLSPASLNKPAILETLKARGLDNDKINILDSILTECERTIYLPGYKSYVHPKEQLLKAAIIVAEIKHLEEINVL